MVIRFAPARAMHRMLRVTHTIKFCFLYNVIRHYIHVEAWQDNRVFNYITLVVPYTAL